MFFFFTVTLKTFFSKLNYKISFTGGEPFIHPNIIELLQFAKKQGVHRLSVTTNGTASLSTYLKALKYINYAKEKESKMIRRQEKLKEQAFKLSIVKERKEVRRAEKRQLELELESQKKSKELNYEWA